MLVEKHPEHTGNHKRHQRRREQHQVQLFAPLTAQIHVQEIAHMHDDLDQVWLDTLE
jgi:hypothetical protein